MLALLDEAAGRSSFPADGSCARLASITRPASSTTSADAVGFGFA